MKFAITSKGDSKSNTLMHRIKMYFLISILVYDEDQPDIVVSSRGDGNTTLCLPSLQQSTR